jgi:hypothetical protein
LRLLTTVFTGTTEVAALATLARRYLDSPGNGWSFYLFVRTDPDAPYAFLGPVRYETHEGDRPIAITWRLAAPMRAILSQRFESLAQA